MFSTFRKQSTPRRDVDQFFFYVRSFLNPLFCIEIFSPIRFFFTRIRWPLGRTRHYTAIIYPRDRFPLILGVKQHRSFFQVVDTRHNAIIRTHNPEPPNALQD